MDLDGMIEPLLSVMARLRDPEGGCPWDLEQNFESIAPYTLEEAYEVAEAIRLGDMAALREELGDLLLQVVYHAQMAREAGAFDFQAVSEGITAKMIRRHPHVFGDAEIRSAEEQTSAWEQAKARERGAEASALDGVALALPALVRAQKIGGRAARTGFDWPDVSGVVAKLKEETAEIEAALAAQDTTAIEDEIGDALFTLTNLARRTGVDAETALRKATAKFESRFRTMEAAVAADGAALADLDLPGLDARWKAAKAATKTM
jgi:nucleoside triphosphate diphosphatase